MQNKHVYIQERFLLFWDNELDAREQNEVAQHLQQCPACGSLYQQLVALYQQSPAEPPTLSPFLWTRLQSRMRGTTVVGKHSLLRPALVTAIALLCIWAGHLLGSFQPPAENVSEEEMLYRSFGMNEMEPFAHYSMAGAVNAVYEGR
jgi:anti-sigma factor RsiW